MKPTVLIATTSRWFPTARLAMALAHAGCIVEAVCPARHPLRKMSAVRRTHAYRGLAPLQSFARAIEAAKPDFILPGDDLATSHLHQLHDHERQRGEDGRAIWALIERSLGAPESFPVVYARTAFIDLAQKAGIRAPRTEVIGNRRDLRKWVARVGLPTVVNAQEFVAGREATSAVACWQGNVLAGLHFEVIHKRDAAGPSSVLRLIENAEMSAAAEKIAARLRLSGLHGFDFMLEAHSGNAYLIEINPRATQVGHLALGTGRDLPAALYAALSGESAHAAAKVTDSDTIALFPQEWVRDPASEYLTSGYHDVPWEEPELIRACVGKRWKQKLPQPKPNPVQSLSPVRLPRL